MDDDIKLIENTETILIKYKHSLDLFELIYDKNKDKCLLMKNGRPANLKILRNDETERYKEILEIAITYHHDKDGEYTH